ncbi:hypothetical protein [Robiginitalea sp. IMCC43444]|uniref:hypothetical protein n=1 Tax=Robiginitalea sp. IMCC43444 TaxID=3459121 RepID=UPI004042E930
MKKLFFCLTFVLLTTSLFAQQGFKLGIHGALPMSSEANDAVSLVAGLDAGYMHALGEVVDVGVATGFINGFPEKFDNQVVGVDLPNVQFLPLAASFRIWLSNSFSFGADGGYALGINEGNDGGLYYRPIIGYLMGAQTEVNISYVGIEVDGSPWATVNLGILYTFPQKVGR